MFKLSAILNLIAMSGILMAQDSKPLPIPTSPGKAIQHAAQASAHDVPQDRPTSGTSEIVGGAKETVGSVEILSDGKGVNFGPYLRDVLADVRSNWYKRIPADAQTKKGKLAIEFAILPDGRIAALKLAETSGDVSLDRPAWEAITAVNPFPALPSAFNGPYLALRLRFYYNPNMADPGGTSGAPVGPIIHAVLAKSIEDSGLPKYPKKARKDKIEGIVRLEAQIAPGGKVQNVQAIDGSLLLGEAASNAIRKWTFHPALRDGKAVKDFVRINVEFQLEGGQVRAQVVGPANPQGEDPAP